MTDVDSTIAQLELTPLALGAFLLNDAVEEPERVEEQDDRIVLYPITQCAVWELRAKRLVCPDEGYRPRLTRLGRELIPHLRHLAEALAPLGELTFDLSNVSLKLIGSLRTGMWEGNTSRLPGVLDVIKEARRCGLLRRRSATSFEAVPTKLARAVSATLARYDRDPGPMGVPHVTGR